MTRHLYNKQAINSAISSYSFFPLFSLTWRGKGWVPKLTGAEATFCSAQGGALAGAELRAVLQQHFNAKLHWKQEASHGILYFYYFFEAVLVSVQLKKMVWFSWGCLWNCNTNYGFSKGSMIKLCWLCPPPLSWEEMWRHVF